MLRILFCLLCILSLGWPVAAEVKIISLKHRAATDLAPEIQRLLGEGEKVQGAGNHLVLIADGESLQAAEALIALLDRELLSWNIRLRQSEHRQQAGEDLSGSISLGHHSQSSLEVSGARHLGTSGSQVEQVLRVMEGESGWLEIGRDIPYTKEWAAFSGETSGYSATIDYKKIAIGFWVHPSQFSDGKVLVEIMPQFSKLEGRVTDPPEIRFSELRTKLAIPVGEWIPLAQQLQRGDRVSRAILSWRAGNDRNDQELFLRIDPAN